MKNEPKATESTGRKANEPIARNDSDVRGGGKERGVGDYHGTPKGGPTPHVEHENRNSKSNNRKDV